jgi:methionine-S-sulfoxide reductase
MNSIALDFEPDNTVAISNKPAGLETITLGGGCFWCIEAIYKSLKGVEKVTSGYSGGKLANPTYREVCTGETGHAEVVQVVFDPNQTSCEEILKVFFTVHDPTTLNRQGADAGTQYRSVIFYQNKEQQEIANELINALNKAKVFDQPIVTKVEPLAKFYAAEDYHQEYYRLHKNEPYCRMVIQPKLEKFEKVFKDRLKK